MSPLIYILLAMTCVGALGFAFAPSLLGSNRADKRRKMLGGDLKKIDNNTAAIRVKGDRRKNVQQTIKDQEAKKQKNRLTLRKKLFQAGMSITPAAYIRNTIIAFVVFFIIFVVIEVSMIVALLLAFMISFIGSKWVVAHKRKRFQNKYLEELPNAVESIVRGIKAGMPLNDSIRQVSLDGKDPVASEFARVIEQQSIGKSMSEAIAVLYEKVPRPEVNFLIVVIAVQQQSGGNLAEALSNLSRMLRDRKKMQGKVKALSSEAKASAGIIGSLPFFVGAMVSLTSPDYLLPLFNTTLGNIWLGIGAFMLSLGVFIMNRMIQFDY